MTSLRAGNPLGVLWTGPAIIVASLMIAWGAEAAQFFIAQGIALAVLALLQTLPEFAVEAVLAKNQEVQFLLANLTGALKLLTGLGWPMIYFAAARAYRREHKSPMRRIRLHAEQSVQIVGLLAGILYELVIWWKGSLTVYDGIVLLTIYIAYLWIMRRLPPSEQESLDEVAAIPRAIVKAPKALRIFAILGLFAIGGVAVFLVADPFLDSLFGLATATGISSFVFIQWVAPLVSEAPEGISAYFWARDHERASIALMNLVSSNISQWTLLAAMLPVVLSFAAGHIQGIPFDAEQSRELLMTLAQSLLGTLFLINMELAWWEAVGLFVLFLFSLGLAGDLADRAVTWVYFGWCGVELIRLLTGNRRAAAIGHFRAILRHSPATAR
jgi:cation:H+ antiporter